MSRCDYEEDNQKGKRKNNQPLAYRPALRDQGLIESVTARPGCQGVNGSHKAKKQ